MPVKSRFFALLLAILVSFPESETANITVVITKSPSPSYAVEGQNITLEWTYTLDGSFGSAKFAISNDDGSELIISKIFSSGIINVNPEYQERFKAEATDTRAELTILAVQRSDEEMYELNILPTGAGSVLEKLNLVVNFSSSITNITGQNVMEGGNVALQCLVEGKPNPTVTWTELSDNGTVTMPLINISRHDSRAFRCTADNGVGPPANRDVFIDVQYKPDTVSLVTNATENTNCSDFLWVNLTCEASDANPPVESFQLLKEGEIVATSIYGTWIMGISEAKDHVYSCNALHLLGNVTADSVIVAFNVPPQVSVFARGSEVLIEGGSVSLHCIASAYPEPTVTWSKLNADVFAELSSWLNFTNIGREEAGNYICIASNTCGKRKSSTTTIDVQYPPELNGRVQNATVAGGVEHTFSCPVGGNPVPHVSWYSESGTYTGKTFRTRQSGCYICVARNIHGISDNITQCLIMNSTVPPTTDPNQTMVSVITASQRQEIRATLTIIRNYEQAFQNLNSASSKELVAKFEKEVDKVYTKMPEYIRAEVTQLRPGSVIVYFILYFNTAVTPEKGIENLRIAISSNGTFGDFQVKDLVLMSEESTKSTKTTGIKGLGILSINVIGLLVSSRSHSPPLALSYSSLPCLAPFSSTSFCHTFSQTFFQQGFAFY